MDDVGIKVIYESEVAKAIKNTQDLAATFDALDAQVRKTVSDFVGAEKAVDSLGDAAGNASGRFVVFNKDMVATSNHMQGFAALARLGEISYKDFGVSAGVAQKSVQKFNAEVQKAPRPVTNATTALTGLTRIAQDAPFGFIAIQNNIAETITQFGALSVQAGGAANGLKALGAAMLGANGIIFGINLVLTGVTALVQRYGSFGAAIDALLNPLSEQEIRQKRMNGVIDEAAKSVSGEIAQLSIIRSKLLELEAPMSERKKALEAYNRISDDNNKLSEKDINNLSRINQLVNEQIRLLGERAIAAAAQKELAKEAESLFSVIRKTNPILEKANTALLQQGKAAAEATKGVKGLRIATEEELEADSSFSKTVTSLFKDVAAIRNSNEYKKAEKELRQAQEAFNAILGDVSGFVDFDGLTKGGASKVEKAGKSVSDVVKEMEKDIVGLNVAFAGVGGSVASLAVNKIRVFEKALRDLADIGVRPGDALFNQIKSQIEQLQNSLMKTPVSIKLPIKIEALPEVAFNHDSFRKAVEEFNYSVVTPFEKNITEAMNRAIQSGISSIATGIASSIGELLGGANQIQNVFNGIIKVFAGFIKQLGETMIAAGAATIAAKNLIKNPYGAIAAGALAIIAGTAIEASLSKYPSFATGGIVNSPTLAMIGDNPGRKEAIVPSEDWREAFGGMRGFDGELVAKIRAQDLLIIMKKAAAQQGRVN